MSEEKPVFVGVDWGRDEEASTVVLVNGASFTFGGRGHGKSDAIRVMMSLLAEKAWPSCEIMHAGETLRRREEEPPEPPEFGDHNMRHVSGRNARRLARKARRN